MKLRNSVCVHTPTQCVCVCVCVETRKKKREKKDPQVPWDFYSSFDNDDSETIAMKADIISLPMNEIG